MAALKKGTNHFNWDRYYLKRIERMNKIDMRMAAIREEAKQLMKERIEIVKEGVPCRQK